MITWCKLATAIGTKCYGNRNKRIESFWLEDLGKFL